MRFNLRWLHDYLETNLSYEELVETLTMAGLEVEEANDLGLGDNPIIYGEILEIEQHPNADRLSLCKVRGDEAEPLQIVCGANNIEPGQRVPLAKIGATFPDGMKLKPTKIRGVESMGMMCSARELGVGEDHDGIWIQPEDAPVGKPFDAIIDISITPNRPDALSLVGIARDVAAKTGGKLKLPEVKFTEAADKIDKAAKVIVEAKEDCPRYAARVIRNIKLGESPVWLKRRLEAAGLRPINNVVDVTNYVMLEMGHPLHAFDLKKLTGSAIVVRHPKSDDKLTLLDETKVALEPHDLLICDAEKPVALAGIMGGLNSEITEETTSVLLESAYFKPATIRRTAKRLGKTTDASYRFERGTDAKKLTVALHRAAQLIAELTGGEVLKGHIDIMGRIPEPEQITLRLSRVKMISGMEMTGRQSSEILTKLGFEIHRAAENELVVSVPSNRPDIHGEMDLIEELARMHGYEKIPYELPKVQSKADMLEPRAELEQRASDILVGLGMTQAVNFSFVSESANVAVGYGDSRSLRVVNPLTADQSAMRRSMVPSMIQNVVSNLNQSVESIRMFEIGRTYAWKSEEDDPEEDPKTMEPPAEERHWLTAALCGGHKPDWRTVQRDYDFFDIKGIAQALMERLGFTRLVVEPVKDIPYLHPGRAAALLKRGHRLCWFGELHPALAKEFDVKKRMYLLECPLEGDVLSSEEAKYRELPRTPAVKRDIAIVVGTDQPAAELDRTIRSAGGDILSVTRLFDLYEGKNIEKGKRSLAFSLTFRDPNPDKTLKDEQVNQAVDKILKALEKKHGAALR